MYAKLITAETQGKGFGIEGYCWAIGYQPSGHCYNGAVPYGWCVLTGGNPWPW